MRLKIHLEVNLKKNKKQTQTQISQVSLTAGELLKTEACSPSPRPKSPCPEGRTWSGLSRPAGHLQWRRRHSLCGWRSRSVNAEETKGKCWCVALSLFKHKQSTNTNNFFFFAYWLELVINNLWLSSRVSSRLLPLNPNSSYFLLKRRSSFPLSPSACSWGGGGVIWLLDVFAVLL